MALVTVQRSPSVSSSPPSSVSGEKSLSESNLHPTSQPARDRRLEVSEKAISIVTKDGKDREYGNIEIRARKRTRGCKMEM